MQRREKGWGFTLIELMVAVAVLVVLVTLVVVVAHPTDTLKKSRDAQRFSDLTVLVTAINLYLADGRDFQGLKGPYASIDPGFDDDNGRRKNDGTGWVPLNFTLVSTGAPVATLPLDPLNDRAHFYRLGVSSGIKTYELNGVFESQENLSKASSDGGNDPNVYEVGTDLTIL